MSWLRGRFRSRLSHALTRAPRLFDLAKRASRALGDRSEQYEFLREFASRNPRCRFLQIGSNDGMINDPLREFIVSNAWTGILVEPVPYVFRRLQRSYRHRSGLHLENAAVSDASGTMRFYAVDEGKLGRLHGAAAFVGSFDRSHVLKHFARSDGIEEYLVEIDVPTVTVSELLDRHGFPGVDLLHIDAEGHEPAILRSIEWERVSPQAVLFESRHLGPEMDLCFALLRSHGYRCFEIGDDSIAVRGDVELSWTEEREPA